MKALKIVFALLFIVCQGQAQNKWLSISEALFQKKIKISKVDVSGLGGNNVRMEIMNLSNENLNIYLEPGLTIEPALTEFQTLLLTDSLMIATKPWVKATAIFTAFCIEPSDMGPRNLAKYLNIKMANPDLKQLALLIGKCEVLNRQSLIWDYIKLVPEYTIHLKQKAEIYKTVLTDFFRINRPKSKLSFMMAEEEKVYVPREAVSIASDLSFMSEEDLTLSFSILTEQGDTVRKVFERKNYPKGTHLIKFGFSDFYPKTTKFRAQLTKPNGEIFKEVLVDETAPYEEKDVHSIKYNYEFLTKQPLTDVAIIVRLSNGEKLMTLKKYSTLNGAYHTVAVIFNHYYKPETKFILELVGADGKVYDRTEFDAYKNSKKLYKEW